MSDTGIGDLARDAAVQVAGPSGDGAAPEFRRRQAYITAIASDWKSASIKFPESTEAIPGVKFMYPSMPMAVGDTVWVDQNGPDTIISSAYGVPLGAVIDLAGGAPVPAGWLVANGQSAAGYPYAAYQANVPDLRDRFIVGAGGAYATGQTGGENFHVLAHSELASHGHTAAGTHNHATGHDHQTPPHDHVVGNTYYTFDSVHSHAGGGGGTLAESPNPSGGGSSPQPVTTPASGGGITGGASSGTSGATNAGGTTLTGDNSAHENRPPFYALVKIIKVV